MNQALLKNELFERSTNAQSVTLTDGKLPAAEVYEPVKQLISTMQSFYWQRNFGHQERFSHNDIWSDRMVAAVESDAEHALALLREAGKNGEKVKIVAKIEIEVE